MQTNEPKKETYRNIITRNNNNKDNKIHNGQNKTNKLQQHLSSKNTDITNKTKQGTQTFYTKTQQQH